jgi:hypothetical protein
LQAERCGLAAAARWADAAAKRRITLAAGPGFRVEPAAAIR